jgi:hypothetical protein
MLNAFMGRTLIDGAGCAPVRDVAHNQCPPTGFYQDE